MMGELALDDVDEILKDDEHIWLGVAFAIVVFEVDPGSNFDLSLPRIEESADFPAHLLLVPDSHCLDPA